MHPEKMDLSHIRCVVFDYGFTLSSGFYFNVSPPGVTDWEERLQKTVFRGNDDTITDPWMRGEIGLAEIAGLLTREIGLGTEEILWYLRRGCTDLGFNEEVYQFARWVRSNSLKSVLVTANMDVFSDVVVPSHGLDDLFDVIVNSADVGTCDKTVLWSLAFNALGCGISYRDSLLIEDGEKNPAAFRKLGGVAHQYLGEGEFRGWLDGADFGENGSVEASGADL
jgi:FMN phosphatase YigB (HAD superfamily)